MSIRFIIAILVITVAALPGYCSENFIVNSLGDIESLEPLETLVFGEVNRIRGDEGLGILLGDMRLDDAARQHSKEMADEGYFKHISPFPELENPSHRVYNSGLTDCTVSENLYWTNEIASDDVLVAKIVQGWLESESHRKAMLTDKYDYSGIGLYRAADGGLFCTQVFTDRTILFDEIEMSSDVEYVRRVTATFESEEDIIYLLDGKYAGRFPVKDGIVLVDILLEYEGGPAVITLGREVEELKIKAFYEEEVDPAAGFYLSYDIIDDSLIKEEVSVEKIGKYNISAKGRIIEPEGEVFIVDGDRSSLVEYEKDGTFAIEYPVYDNTGTHYVYFVVDNSTNHRIIVNSEKPLEEAFMKMQVLPNK